MTRTGLDKSRTYCNQEPLFPGGGATLQEKAVDERWKARITNFLWPHQRAAHTRGISILVYTKPLVYINFNQLCFDRL